MGEPREFIQESYNESDQLAKDLVGGFLRGVGYDDIESEENFNHDMTAVRGGDKYYFELEIKRRYRFRGRETYPFPTVHFLGRKERLHHMQLFYYVIIGALEEWAVICHSGDIFKDENRKYVHIATTSRYGYDEMFEVHKNKCLFVNLNTGYRE
jgi:hypothetical protein